MFRFCFTADIILLLFGCYSVDNPTKELSAIEDRIEILSDPPMGNLKILLMVFLLRIPWLSAGYCKRPVF